MVHEIALITIEPGTEADFQQWRALVGPYFASPPQVEHTQTVIQGF